jgi:phage shock protein A
MDMSANTLNLYEALVKFVPNSDKDDALAVVRTIETAIHHGHKHAEKQILDKAMTREDGQRLEQKVTQLDQKVGQLDQKVDKLKTELASVKAEIAEKIGKLETSLADKMNRQIGLYVSLMFVAVAAATTAAKWLH